MLSRDEFLDARRRQHQAEERSRRHAAQTRIRANRRAREKERKRLLGLGVDRSWVERVLGP